MNTSMGAFPTIDKRRPRKKVASDFGPCGGSVVEDDDSADGDWQVSWKVEDHAG